ncbi:MAG: T9SS type A sorting domain-containing protein [Bacteroidales bacterium]|nr:T9SS type A sorting domain-containing protein [Bacteroidales bacterium]
MEKLIFILIMTTFYSILVIPQDATFYKLAEGCAPVIDGEVDTIWNKVEKHSIEKNFTWDGIEDQPTLNEATWQAVWNDTAIFILIDVKDDDFCPWWCTGQADWLGDKPEIYFDVNVNNLDDGQGPVNYPNGHYLFAPNFYDPDIHPYQFYQFCGIEFPDLNFCYAYKIDSPNYVFEYNFPLDILTDNNDNTIEPSKEPTIGFDVVIIDVDSANGIRNRAVWMQDGTGDVADESWNNMDDAGEVIYSIQKVGKPNVSIKKLPNGCEVIIDGTIDDLWDQVEPYDIDQNFLPDYEEPTVYKAIWKAIWNDTAIFMLVSVMEDYFCEPYFCCGNMGNRGDKPFLYFDMNTSNLNDGAGPVGFPNGHYEFAPGSNLGTRRRILWTDSWQGWHYGHAYYLENISSGDTNIYHYEYCIPFSTLVNSVGNTVNSPAGQTIGFDVEIMDSDGCGDSRIVWSNNGKTDENWNNMDDAGLLTFSIEEIELDCATKIEHYQPVSFTIYPVPATDKIYLSSINELERIAIIDITGKTIVTIKNIHSFNWEISIEDLKTGIYLIQFTDKKGYITTERFLKK